MSKKLTDRQMNRITLYVPSFDGHIKRKNPLRIILPEMERDASGNTCPASCAKMSIPQVVHVGTF